VKVVVICEDFRKDQYIAKPLVEAMLGALRIRPTVIVAKEPMLRGVMEVLDWPKLMRVIDRYRGMAQLFLLLVDRDGNEKRRNKLDEIEKAASKHLGPNVTFLSENAWQEIEVWALAAQPLPAGWSWSTIRAEINPKERYFIPLVERRELTEEPAGGWRTMGLEAAKAYKRVRMLCKEDVARLEQRIQQHLPLRSGS
jgi:hypothetical protein